MRIRRVISLTTFLSFIVLALSGIMLFVSPQREGSLLGGMEVEVLSQRLLEIAEANGTTPQALAQIIVSVARPMAPDEMAARQPGGGAAGAKPSRGPTTNPIPGWAA